MKQIRVNLDSENAVPLPYSNVVELHGDGTATVEVPDEYVKDDGTLDEAAIRELYKGQPKWDKPGVTEGILA